MTERSRAHGAGVVAARTVRWPPHTAVAVLLRATHHCPPTEYGDQGALEGMRARVLHHAWGAPGRGRRRPEDAETPRAPVLSRFLSSF